MAVRTAAPTRAAAGTGLKRSETKKKIVVYGILLLWSLIIFFPIYWVVIASFKLPVAFMGASRYVPWVDFKPDLHAWAWAFFSEVAPTMILPTFLTSTIAALGAASAATFFGAMAAYGLARFEYKLGSIKNNDIAFWFISQRMLPPAVLLMAFLIMYRQLNLLDTQLGLVIVYTGFNLPFVVWIMRDFFAGLPVDLEESALIDGCSRLGAFVRIAIPLAAPGLVAVFLFSVIFAWNEFLFALVLTFTEVQTVPLMVSMQATQRGVQYWNMSAIALLSMIPAFVAAMALEKHIAKGLTMGAIK